MNVDDIIMWFDEGGALQVADDARAEVALKGFEIVPDLLRIVHHVGLAPEDDAATSVAACELVLEALVARKKISRSDGGQYGRATPEPRRRPNQDLFGGGLSVTHRAASRSGAPSSSDLAAVVALRLALLREYGDHPLYAELRPDVVDRAFDLYHAQIVAADERSFSPSSAARRSAFSAASTSRGSPLVLPERYCYVSSVYVRAVGAAPGRAARARRAPPSDWCDERGLGEMRLHNASSSRVAVAAWSALGFEVVEQVRRRVVRAPDNSHDEREFASQIAPAR